MIVAQPEPPGYRPLLLKREDKPPALLATDMEPCSIPLEARKTR